MKLKTLFFPLLVALLCPAGLHAQADALPAGAWSGWIRENGVAVPAFSRMDGGTDTLTFDCSPGRAAVPFRISQAEGRWTCLYNETLRFPVQLIRGDDFHPDRITGAVPTGQGILEMELLHSPVRQPEPVSLVKFKEKELFYGHDSVKLAGTLARPKSPKPFPVVVLINGSGMQERDCDLLGFRMFRVLSDYLAPRGIGVFRYDDRSMGKSAATGLETCTSEDFAKDVASAVAMLRLRKDVDPDQIYLLGHSEGGAIAPMVAANDPRIAGMLLVSGPGAKGQDVLVEQGRLISLASGVSPEAVAQNARVQELAFASAQSGDFAPFETEMRRVLHLGLDTLAPAVLASYGDTAAYIRKQIDQQESALKSHWLRFFMQYNPIPTLAKTNCPTLLIFGGKDLQVPISQNLKSMEMALQVHPHPGHGLVVFPEANHLFQDANRGTVAEYVSLPKSYVPGFMETVYAWVKREAAR